MLMDLNTRIALRLGVLTIENENLIVQLEQARAEIAARTAELASLKGARQGSATGQEPAP